MENAANKATQKYIGMNQKNYSCNVRLKSKSHLFIQCSFRCYLLV